MLRAGLTGLRPIQFLHGCALPKKVKRSKYSVKYSIKAVKGALALHTEYAHLNYIIVHAEGPSDIC